MTEDQPLWMECVPILCLDIGEVHVPDRVMHQLHVLPSWGTNQHVHDRHKRLGSEVLEMLDKYFCDWGNRHQSLAVEVDDGTREAEYRLWYMQYGRLLIGKPGLEVDVSSDIVHSTGSTF
uniref:Aminotransferase-like plant mobile domain-containing protein n=1 Tax=Solanum lycopersicum TaxID=4081 RepID=A0A3Q7J761_SOLLC